MDELEKVEQDEGLDYETIVEKQTDQLTELLDRRDMKELQRRMEEINEFDVAEFLSEIDDNRMPMVFRLLILGLSSVKTRLKGIFRSASPFHPTRQ